MSFFRISASFGKSFRKIALKDGLSFKSNEAFPKTEILEKLHIIIVIQI